MKEVIILISERTDAVSISGTQMVLKVVNQFYEEETRSPFFNVRLVGLSKAVKIEGESMVFNMDILLKNAGRTDLIIIPAINGHIAKGNMRDAIKAQKDFIPWINEQYKNGAEVASLCTGSFLLAATGLMKGKMCSTHWGFANEFREIFPDVILTDDKVITDQNGLYSSGGSTASWNLLLYLVEKYISREMAITASKYFLLDIDKSSQLPFTIFIGQRAHDDNVVLAAQKYIEEHAHDKLSIEEVANKFNLERRTFERRFKKATSNTATEYAQRVKVEGAKKLLEAGRKTVNEVMYDVGYNDTKAFRDVFKRYVGMSPVDYRERYQKYF
jgi:transcriptional regulator GlxA family with amidase domain